MWGSHKNTRVAMTDMKRYKILLINQLVMITAIKVNSFKVSYTTTTLTHMGVIVFQTLHE